MLYPQSSRILGAPANKGRRYQAEPLTEYEVRALIRAVLGPRADRHPQPALIAVLYRGGLRIAEALALYPKDKDQAMGERDPSQ